MWRQLAAIVKSPLFEFLGIWIITHRYLCIPIGPLPITAGNKHFAKPSNATRLKDHGPWPSFYVSAENGFSP